MRACQARGEGSIPSTRTKFLGNQELPHHRQSVVRSRQSLGLTDVGVVRTGFIEGREVGSHFDGKSKALNSVVPRSRKGALNGSYTHSWFDSKTLD
jgi:hypothetical protein